MAKPEWGTKRLCRNGGCRFYDLKREPIVCPKCEKDYQPEAPAKSRRYAVPPATDIPSTSRDNEESAELDQNLDGLEEQDSGHEEEEKVMEDASELDDESDVNDMVDTTQKGED